MTIQWLSSKRVEGDDAEKDTIPVNSLESGYSFTALDTPQEYIWNGVDTWVPIGGDVPPPVTGFAGWKELARTTLGGVGSVIDVTGIDNKRYYMLLLDARRASSSVSFDMTLNGGASGYSDRIQVNDGGDQTRINQVSMDVFPNNADGSGLNVAYVSNLVGKEKLIQNLGTYDFGNMTNWLGNGKSTLSAAINQITLTSNGTNRMAAGAELVVLGWDPADTSFNNFWEPLALNEGDGTSQTLSSGTILARKYLWIQLFSDSIAQDSELYFNGDNAGTTYTTSTKVNVGNRVTSATDNAWKLQATSPNFTEIFVLNNQTVAKYMIARAMDNAVAGADNNGNSRNLTGKWNNTGSQITEVVWDNSTTAVNFGSNSFMRIWGHD